MLKLVSSTPLHHPWVILGKKKILDISYAYASVWSTTSLYKYSGWSLKHEKTVLSLILAQNPSTTHLSTPSAASNVLHARSYLLQPPWPLAHYSLAILPESYANGFSLRIFVYVLNLTHMCLWFR